MELIIFIAGMAVMFFLINPDKWTTLLNHLRGKKPEDKK